MIGVVIPAHDEAVLIDRCVRAAHQAAAHSELAGETVEIVFVADSYSDATVELAAAAGASVVVVNACNVGMARAAGADWLLERNARWLAFTDAVTIGEPDWLVHQLARNVDVVCGTVEVTDWSPHAQDAGFLQEHFARTYSDLDGHRHIHGANLGIAATAYLRSGGFQPLASSEHVALIAALQASGARFAWSAAPRVATSARTDAKARGGFGDTLLDVVRAHQVAQQLQRQPRPQSS